MLDVPFYISAGITIAFSLLASIYHYYRFSKRDIAMAIAFYGLLVFCIIYFVSFEDNVGLGIGLLGILSMIRLRSTAENMIDIGYIFYVIVIGLLNASVKDWQTIVTVNGVLMLILFFLSSGLIYKQNSIQTELIFDDLEAEKLDDRIKLMNLIEKKIGIRPYNIRVKSINYLKDSITVDVTYDARDY